VYQLYIIRCGTIMPLHFYLFAGKTASVIRRLLRSPARSVRVHLSETKFLFAFSARVVQQAAAGPREAVLISGNNRASARRQLNGISLVVTGQRLVECKDASTADDTAQWKVAVADRCLDSSDETSTTRDTVSARVRRHRRRRRQADYTLAHATPS